MMLYGSQFRATLIALCACAVLVALTAIHKVQDDAYWAYVEKTLRVEHAATEEWQQYVNTLEELSAQPGVLAADPPVRPDALADGPPCPPPPKCEERTCPQPALSPRGVDGRVEALLSRHVPGDEPSASERRLFDPAANDGVDFKVFVYDLPPEFNTELKAKQPRCVGDQYGTEIRFHEHVLASAVHTKDPDQAEFFLVPLYGECHLYMTTEKHGAAGLDATNEWFLRALREVTHGLPHWNRTQGRDHLFLFAGARGAKIFKDWKKHIRKSVFLTPEGDRSLGFDQFNTWKDIVIPGLEYHPDLWSGKLREMEFDRDIFAFFMGTIRNKNGETYSRGIRAELEEISRGKEGIIFKEHSSDCNRDCYMRSMRRSVFCLCPRGWTPWTLRAYQAMMVGCVPVIIADEIEFPFEDELDWRALTVKIPEANATGVMSVLRAIPDDVIQAKRDAISKVWRMVTWPTKAEEGDAFHAVLRQLQRKRRYFKSGTGTWWV